MNDQDRIAQLEDRLQAVERDNYHDNIKTCQLCGEDVQDSDVSAFIVVKAELAATGRGMVPGIYKILHRQFLLIPMVGSGSIFSSDVRFTDKLPKPDAEYEISGHICRTCAKPFEKTYNRVYRIRPLVLKKFGSKYRGCRGRRAKWDAVLNYEGWDIVKAHIRKTVLANPDMLRDLECDSLDRDLDGHHLPYAYASDWEELKERYDLPDLPTYHEQLFLEHKGVKVFFQHSPKSASWFALRPEPRFRGQYCAPFVFAASGLPTWRSKDRHCNLYGEETEEAKRAMIEAIDLGVLTQDGVLDKDGKVCFCG